MIQQTLEKLEKLTHLNACFLEGARLYRMCASSTHLEIENATDTTDGAAPGALLTRELTEDVVVQVEHPSPETIALKKGTSVHIDMISMRSSSSLSFLEYELF